MFPLRSELIAAQDTGRDPSVALLRLLWGVANVNRSQIHLILARHNLTEAMAGALWMLDASGGTVPMRDIAPTLGCDPSNVSLISDRLEKLGLVERQPHPDDGRARVLAPTAKGRTVWSEALREMTATSALGRLTASEQTRLQQLLDKMR